MDEKTINKDSIEIDLRRLFGVLLSKAWLIAVVAVLCAVLTFAWTVLFVTPKYQSSVMFYVNNTDLSVGGATVSIGASDISASRGLVDVYIVILKTRGTILDVIDYAGVDLSYGQVAGMISAGAVNETEVFRVTVTHSNPVEAEQIADAISYILPKRITNIIDGTSAKVVDEAIMPISPSSPNYTRNTMMGFLVGAILISALIVILDLMDSSIRVEEDITQNCKHPVLATVPDMNAQSKGGYGKTVIGSNALIGDDISFAAAEAYKLLRTKLQFSFVGDGDCRVIGVSSALTGEGKSLSSVNLAYSVAQLGKRVLLIDCDMRRPSMQDKLPVRKDPGLSDYLTGQTQSENLIQLCSLKEGTHTFHVISSGRIPPNPVELLSSAKMEKMLSLLRERYDYIILDLPPVREVSDALAAAKLTDGMLLVVRHNYCDRSALTAAVRQFEFVDAKILGILFNCASEESANYGKYYKKYGRYYKRYGKSYYKYEYGSYGKQDSAPGKE